MQEEYWEYGPNGELIKTQGGGGMSMQSSMVGGMAGGGGMGGGGMSGSRSHVSRTGQISSTGYGTGEAQEWFYEVGPRGEKIRLSR